MSRTTLRWCVLSCAVLGLATWGDAKKLREKFDGCLLTGADEEGNESAELGGEGPGKATENVEAGEVWLKCRAKVQNLSGEKQEYTGECFVFFISDGALAIDPESVEKISKKGKAKLFCHATRDDVVEE